MSWKKVWLKIVNYRPYKHYWNEKYSKSLINNLSQDNFVNNGAGFPKILWHMFSNLQYTCSMQNKTCFKIIKYWDTSTSSQVSNCDGFVLEIYLDHKFQWPQEGLNCESLAYEVVT